MSPMTPSLLVSRYAAEAVLPRYFQTVNRGGINYFRFHYSLLSQAASYAISNALGLAGISLMIVEKVS